MDVVGFGYLTTALKAYGPYGLMIVILYIELRHMRRMNEQYREDNHSHQKQVDRILAEHKEYMGEIRRMYESNVLLVDNYKDLARDLKDVVIMNTTAITRLCDDVRQNQYCPMQRVDKKKIEVGA